MSAGKLGALLVSKGLITNEQLSSAVALQAQEKTRLGSSLVKLGHVNENVLVSFLSTQYGIAAVSLEGTKVPKEVSRLVPKALCLKHMMVPISVENNR
ncbi:MAG: type II secretion system protein GspE, partial [Proteobacteria bacterium]|nr:type II secretion system protein GspE [Pseudomonadota bacterium]